MAETIHVMSRNEAIVAIGDGKLDAFHVVSINGNDQVPPPIFSRFGISFSATHFDDVPRDLDFGVTGYKAVTESHVGEILSLFSSPPNHHEDRNVIIHCSAGYSRSSGLALAIFAQNNMRNCWKDESKDCDRAQLALNSLRDLRLSIKKTLDMNLRKNPKVLPNVRIVWYADQILGYNYHLLNEYVCEYEISDVWQLLGEPEPESWNELS